MVLFRSSNVGLLPGRTTDKTRLPLKSRRPVLLSIEIDLVLGGHEHDNVQQWRGLRFAPIFKADANARSTYVLDLEYDTGQRRLAPSLKAPPLPARASSGQTPRRRSEQIAPR